MFKLMQKKNQKIKIICGLMLVLVLLSFAGLAFAQSIDLGLGHGTLPNQSRADSFKELITIVLNALLGIATTVAVIFIIIGGYQYASSGVNEDLRTKAKKTLTWAIIGLAAVILSAVAVNTLIALLS